MSARRDVSGEESALRELDRLVVEAAATVRGALLRRARRPRPCDDEATYPDDWGESLPETPDPEPPAEDVPEVDIPPDLASESGDDLGDDRPRGPLTEAETRFVEQTVRWLERRDNKDVIVDQIWRRLLGPQDERPRDHPGDDAPGDVPAENGEAATDDPDVAAR